MLAALTAFAITSAARLLTGARALWLGSTAQATQRLYYANPRSHG
ncbi:MAG: 1-acyl-sn-glycerol-3-phosphate acyltransferase, partial [Pseudomonas sp.]|nr:1-acyl-sn-glycerol-3-phosphate acyltransferase [Pseudomonas sp.]